MLIPFPQFLEHIQEKEQIYLAPPAGAKNSLLGSWYDLAFMGGAKKLPLMGQPE